MKTFITKYQQNPDLALEWLNQRTASEIAELSISREDFIQLIECCNAKTSEISQLTLMQNVLDEPDIGLAIDKLSSAIRCQINPINVFIEKNSPRLTQLFSSFSEFLTLTTLNPTFALTLFNCNPQELVKLITTFEQFMELANQSSSLANGIFEAASNKVIELITNYKQFIQLQQRSSYLAGKIFEKAPDKIAGFFTTFEQFMELQEVSSYLARKVFEAASDKIISLITSYDQFRTLHSKDNSLARRMLELYPNRINALPNSKNSQAPRLANNPPSIIGGYSRPQSTPKTPKAQLSEKDSSFNPPPSPRQSNYSFFLKVCSTLGLIGGIALTIAGFMLAQPGVLGAGLLLSTASLAGFGLFSSKNNEIPMSKCLGTSVSPRLI